MKYFFTFIISCFLSTLFGFSQIITGAILDKNTQPIAYATIQINTDFGVLSNEEGSFSIDTEKFKPTDSVFISYLGYKKIRFLLKDFTSKDYTLEEEINELSEITVSNKVYSLEEILNKIQGNLEINYLNTPIKRQIFKRTSSSTKYKRFEFEFLKATLLSKKNLKEVNKSLNELINNNINQSSKYFSESLTELLKADKKSKLKVIKATKLVNKKNDKSSGKFQKQIMNIIANHLEKDATYKVSSGILPVEDSLSISDDLTKKLYKDKLELKKLKKSIKNNIKSFDISNSKNKGFDFIHKTKKYNYTLKGTSTFDNEKIYIINFTPKKSSAKFKGTLYVNAYDFAVIKLKYGFAKGKNNSKNLKFLLGIKYDLSKNNVEVLYHKNNLGFYSLKFAKQETVFYAYMNRSLKFKKNRVNRSEDKRVLKMEFLLEMDNSSKIELFVLDETEITIKDIENFKEEKEYKMHYIPKYNPQIWKGYNVLSPVKEITNYNTGQ